MERPSMGVVQEAMMDTPAVRGALLAAEVAEGAREALQGVAHREPRVMELPVRVPF